MQRLLISFPSLSEAPRLIHLSCLLPPVGEAGNMSRLSDLAKTDAFACVVCASIIEAVYDDFKRKKGMKRIV